MYKQIREYLTYLEPVLGNRFGIEIEMEGESLPHISNSLWEIFGDGSLRGNACEYVLRTPSYGSTVAQQIELLIAYLKEHGSIRPSDRCGVHIHINVQNLRLNQLYNMLVLYFISEELLIEEYSPERKGNLFCLSGQDAEGVIDWLHGSMRRSLARMLTFADTQTLKYAALNLSSLTRFGTLEFRAFSTPRNIDGLRRIMDLVKIFGKMKLQSRKYVYPIDIITDVSELGPKDFFVKNYPLLNAEVPDLEDKVFTGVRLIQEIAYLFQEISNANKS